VCLLFNCSIIFQEDQLDVDDGLSQAADTDEKEHDHHDGHDHHRHEDHHHHDHRHDGHDHRELHFRFKHHLKKKNNT
jgi:hypothetical protein